MGPQEEFESLDIDFPLGVLCPGDTLEVGHGLMFVDNLDFLDQAIEPQSDGGVCDAVCGGQFFERSTGEHESLDESPVLVGEEIEPSLLLGLVRCHAYASG